MNFVTVYIVALALVVIGFKNGAFTKRAALIIAAVAFARSVLLGLLEMDFTSGIDAVAVAIAFMIAMMFVATFLILSAGYGVGVLIRKWWDKRNAAR